MWESVKRNSIWRRMRFKNCEEWRDSEKDCEEWICENYDVGGEFLRNRERFFNFKFNTNDIPVYETQSLKN
jgi:hypothetical protein